MRGFQTIIRSPRLFVLLLGDRSWIETAHEIEHKDQLGLSAGNESGLGARFVEKVIQLSYRLPAMKSEARETFAKIVLGARQTPPAVEPPEEAAAQEAGPPPKPDAPRGASRAATRARQNEAAKAQEEDRRALEALRALDAAITKILARRLSVAERERLIQTAKRIALKAAPKAAVDSLANLKLVAAAGGDATQQTEVFNAVTRLAASLPNNPRQIKRIFMAFGVYETVGRIYLNYQLTPQGPDGEVRAKRWRQLAMWVTLATEWPETWRVIACEPQILATAYAPATRRKSLEKDILGGLSEPMASRSKTALWRLRNDPSLVALLTAKPGSGAGASGFTDTAMDVEAVYEFNRIIWEPGFAVQTRAAPL